MKLHAAVGGVDADGDVDGFIVDDELQVAQFVLFGVAPEALFSEDCLEGRAFERVVAVADDHHIVAAGRICLATTKSTPYIPIVDSNNILGNIIILDIQQRT